MSRRLIVMRRGPRPRRYGLRRARHPGMLNIEDLNVLGIGFEAVVCRRGQPVAVLMIVSNVHYHPGVRPADHALVVETINMATGKRETRSLSDFGMVPNAARKWNKDHYLRLPSSGR